MDPGVLEQSTLQCTPEQDGNQLVKLTHTIPERDSNADTAAVI